MMNSKVQALALSLLMPALTLAASNICLPENSTRSAAHFVTGALVGAAQGKGANYIDGQLKGAAADASKADQDAAAHKRFVTLQGVNILGAIAGGHVNDLVGERVVNTVLLSKTGDAARRSDADKIASALGQQAGHALIAKKKFALAANPFDLLMVFSWLKTQLQAAQDYAAAEVAEYSSTEEADAKAKVKMMKKK